MARPSVIPAAGRPVSEATFGTLASAQESLLRDSYLFRSLDDEARREVIESGYVLSFEAEETILRQGEPGDIMYLVLSGSVNVIREEGDEELRLAKLGVGACLGEVSVLVGGPRTATIRAREEGCELIALHKHRIERVLNSHPRVRAVLESIISRRAQATIEKMRRHQGDA